MKIRGITADNINLFNSGFICFVFLNDSFWSILSQNKEKNSILFCRIDIFCKFGLLLQY